MPAEEKGWGELKSGCKTRVSQSGQRDADRLPVKLTLIN